MRAEERKAAIAAYKERKVVGGVYLVRCTASEEAWIGQCPDLSSIENRIWVTLRLGNHPNRSLQRSWAAHGAAAFAFMALERVEADTPYLRSARLKERAEHWLAQHNARRI